MPRIAIAQLRDGDIVEQHFVLASKQMGQTNSNKLFIKAECTDATGNVHVRMWNANRDGYDRLPNTGFVLVRGRIETYQGHLQLIADAITPIDDPSKLDLSELIKHTRKNVPEMYNRTKDILTQIKDKTTTGHRLRVPQRRRHHEKVHHRPGRDGHASRLDRRAA